MPNQSSGGVRVLRVAGISVYLHWTWFIVLGLALMYGRETFHSGRWQVWSIAGCLLLFSLVLLHEFGHALACRSVGGKAERIMLWPLGGLAFVKPPPRAGALLWSVAAGPLVNVVLLIISLPLTPLFWHVPGDGATLLRWGFLVNAGLLIFNLLPIYPLDGGQIVQALLWFVAGRRRSLSISGWVGIVVAILAACVCLAFQQWWLALIAAFGTMQSWIAIKQAKLLRARENAARTAGFRCPACHAAPPAGAHWRCTCGQPFDTFANGAGCPRCGKKFQRTACLECGCETPISRWAVALPLPPIASQPTPLAVGAPGA